MRKLLVLPIIILFIGCYTDKDFYEIEDCGCKEIYYDGRPDISKVVKTIELDDCLPIEYGYDSQNLPVYWVSSNGWYIVKCENWKK